MAGVSQHRIRAELDRLLSRVPLGADRCGLEARARELREQARWERGMADNHATANHLHEDADLYELAAQERFPREGDSMVETVSGRIAHEMSAKRWTCINCGAVERLTFYPDCCSFCGGAMECDDGRSTLDAGEPEIPFEVYNAAANGDEEATVMLWMDGAPKGTYRQDVLADLLLRNGHEQLMSLFAEAA